MSKRSSLVHLLHPNNSNRTACGLNLSLCWVDVVVIYDCDQVTCYNCRLTNIFRENSIKPVKQAKPKTQKGSCNCSDPCCKDHNNKQKNVYTLVYNLENPKQKPKIEDWGFSNEVNLPAVERDGEELYIHSTSEEELKVIKKFLPGLLENIPDGGNITNLIKIFRKVINNVLDDDLDFQDMLLDELYNI